MKRVITYYRLFLVKQCYKCIILTCKNLILLKFPIYCETIMINLRHIECNKQES